MKRHKTHLSGNCCDKRILYWRMDVKFVMTTLYGKITIVHHRLDIISWKLDISYLIDIRTIPILAMAITVNSMKGQKFIAVFRRPPSYTPTIGRLKCGNSITESSNTYIYKVCSLRVRSLFHPYIWPPDHFSYMFHTSCKVYGISHPDAYWVSYYPTLFLRIPMRLYAMLDPHYRIAAAR